MELLVLLLVALAVSALDVRRVVPLAARHGVLKTKSLPAAQYTLPLSDKVNRPQYKQSILRTATGRVSTLTSEGYASALAGVGNDQEYLVDITAGGQKFKVIVDTGSSGLWFIKKGFKCYNFTSYPVPQSACGFGSSGFDVSKSTTFVSYPDHNYNISYGGGQFLTGVVGFETVTVGGMTVQKQEIGFVTDAAWAGDGVTSGTMGLAYSQLTDVYTGTDPTKDSGNNAAPYNSIFITAVAEHVVSNPYFSVALNRGSLNNEEDSSSDLNLGYISFGGIAPVKTSQPSVIVPVQYYQIWPGSSQVYSFYIINIDAYIFDGSTKLTGSGKQAVIDTGTTLNWLPTDIAKAYNAKFSPPAKFDKNLGYYLVDCNAIAPSFVVKIAGAKFEIDGRDQAVALADTNSKDKDTCMSGVQNGGDPSNANSIFMLGQVFLHNVVATFNVQSHQISFTQRAKY